MKYDNLNYDYMDAFKAWSEMALVTTQMMQAQARAFSTMMQTTSAYTSLAGSRTAGQFVERQAKLSRAVGRSAVSLADASGTAAKLTRRISKPVRTKAKRSRK